LEYADHAMLDEQYHALEAIVAMKDLSLKTHSSTFDEFISPKSSSHNTKQQYSTKGNAFPLSQRGTFQAKHAGRLQGLEAYG
jgi:hypothetical protein